MNKLCCLIVIFFTWGLSVTWAQPFYPVGGGTDGAIYSLFADTLNNTLYAGGDFLSAGGINSKSISYWNGNTWDSLNNALTNIVKGINILNGELYISNAGTFDSVSGLWTGGPLKWDTLNKSWIILSPDFCCGYYQILNNNNSLYFTGQFDSIGGLYSPKIARYDGNNWYSFPPLDTNGGGLSTAIFYNSELYVGGVFVSQIFPFMDGIAKWNGTQWLPVGNGLGGGVTVLTFTIYQGKLIVGGDFNTSIIAWDGTSWSQLGTNMSNGGFIWALQVYNGELWAGGLMTVNGISTYLAKFNGTQWDTVGITLDNVVSSMAVLGNDLYIAGGFWTMDGDTVNRIIRYNTLTGFETLQPNNNQIEIYPNPVTDKINITTKTNELVEVNFYDITARKLFNQSFINSTSINTEQLAKGIYLYELRNKNGVIKKGKVVKD